LGIVAESLVLTAVVEEWWTKSRKRGRLGSDGHRDARPIVEVLEFSFVQVIVEALDGTIPPL
jgi:hypothetical protein